MGAAGDEGREIVRAKPGGVLVEVRVRPRSRPRWDLVGENLVIGVTAAPVGGYATEEARRALAKVLGVAPGRVSLHRGTSSRTKVFAISGIEVGAARAALDRAVGIPRGTAVDG